MFEGKPPIAARAARHLATADEDDALRPVSWGEIAARLAAARELRAVLLREAAAANGKYPVNLPDSTYRKGGAGKPSASHDASIPAPRGIA